jgi:dTDP-glucose 4,6-dehydratase
VIPLFVTNFLDGIAAPLYGDGQNVRDWCYVDDNCAAIDLVLRRGSIGEVYNVASGDERSNLDLATLLVEFLGVDDSMIEYVDDRLGHDQRYSVTTEKIRSLGWAPRRELGEALATTVDWYRDHRAWWEPLKRPSPRPPY